MAASNPNRGQGEASASPDFDPKPRASVVTFEAEPEFVDDYEAPAPEPKWDGTITRVKLAFPVLYGDAKGHHILGHGDEIELRAKYDRAAKRFVSGPDMGTANQLMEGGNLFGTEQAAARAQQDAAVMASRALDGKVLPELKPIRTGAQLKARTSTQGMEGSLDEQRRREHGESQSGIQQLVDLLKGQQSYTGAHIDSAGVTP